MLKNNDYRGNDASPGLSSNGHQPLANVSGSTIQRPAGQGTSGNQTYNGDTIDLGSVFSSIGRRKKLMLITALTVTVLGALWTMRQKSVYQATCSILLTTPSENSPVATDSLRSLLGATQPRSVGTQLAIMRSYPVQRAAVKALPASTQKLLEPYYKLDVQPQRDSDAIDLIAESRDPKAAADLANALSREYMLQYQQQNKAQVIAGTKEVADQLVAAKKRLNDASTALKNYKVANRTIDLGEESKA
ncbi:hypothetical protein EON80_27470, partial [bacterium]